MKKTLLFRSNKTSIKVYRTYLIAITSQKDELIVAYTHIKECFINQNIDLKPSLLVYLAKQFPLYIIDSRGKTLAKVSIKS
ncbi:MAG: hypothetical protein RBQ81_08370 [Arcobacteraceae bacterium]|jgi:hypothetical protein|nr:hypothetical protein [Arcobacteraceae bacterium]